MSKKLIIKNNDEFSFSVSGAEEEIKTFINWVRNYGRGIFKKKENAIICVTPSDLTACRLKALRQKLNVKKEDIA